METNLSEIIIRKGAHDTREAGMCAMEAVAFLAREPHSDQPACACPVVSSAVRRLNDRIRDDKTRTELLSPLLPKLLNSRIDSTEVMRKRVYVAADWAVRVFTPVALRARGRIADAEMLEGARPICDKKTAEAGRKLAAAYADAAAYAAAAYAADAADADAADAAAAAAADADAYADAAAYAADAGDDAGGRSIYAKAIEMIEAMLAVRE